MLTETHELDTEEGTDTIVITTHSDHVTVLFHVDGGWVGEDRYELDENGEPERLRWCRESYANEGYRLISSEYDEVTTS